MHRFEGTVTAIVGTFLDITQRRRGEQALAEAEARFRLLVESAKDFAIFTLDEEGTVVSWNSGAERILGWSEGEIVGPPAATWCSPPRIAKRRVPAKGNPPGARNRAAPTTNAGTCARMAAVSGASGVMARMEEPAGAVTGLVKIMRDNTDSKMTEEQLKARDRQRRARPPAGRRRQPREGRIHRGGQPRAAHAAQHHPPVDAHARQRKAAGQGSRRRRADDQPRGDRAAAGDRRPVRRVAHRLGQAQAFPARDRVSQRHQGRGRSGRARGRRRAACG